MESNDQYFEYKRIIPCNTQYNYTIVLVDAAGNEETITESYQNTLNYLPTKIKAYGTEYPKNISHIGNIRYYVTIENPFNDHSIHLSIYNEAVSYKHIPLKITVLLYSSFMIDPSMCNLFNPLLFIIGCHP